MSSLHCVHLGATSYRDGLRLQESLVRARVAARDRDDALEVADAASPSSHDWLLYPDHPPVLTIGRAPSEGSLRVPHEILAARGLEVFEVARGGDITWHGPGQLVGYPICDLGTQDHDLHRFLRNLELALVDALAGWGVEGRQVPGRTGIWVGDAKIASIGIAVRRWVTYHGFALNVRPDLAEFDVIHPCGLRGIRMTSLERLMGGSCPSPLEARRVVAEALAARLGYSGAVWEGPEAAWNAAGVQPAETEAAIRWNPTAA